MPSGPTDPSFDPWGRHEGGLLFLPFPSRAMRDVQERVRRFAASPVPLLILGETGTGKDVCAHAIWDLGGAERPFVALNCAAIPSDLMESELFGHVRGAFTGAVQARDGIMARADGGILFLDELAEMAAPAQAKLLRALETGEYRPVGSDRERKAEIRLLAASSQDLDRLAAQGRFRPELLHRLGAVRITLPPLRQRLEDVELLAGEFLQRFRARCRGPAPAEISDGALDLMKTSRWPGNVRQLRNVVEAAAAMAGAEALIGEHHVVPFLPTGEPELASSQSFPTLSEAVERAEAAVVLEALRRSGGNREKAAQLLEVSEATFYRKLKALRELGRIPPFPPA